MVARCCNIQSQVDVSSAYAAVQALLSQELKFFREDFLGELRRLVLEELKLVPADIEGKQAVREEDAPEMHEGPTTDF